jgi:hypothetical protein
MLMALIFQTLPPELELRPVYVAPDALAMVSPKVVSAEARVMVVSMYCWAATVPVQLLSHSVPVP